MVGFRNLKASGVLVWTAAVFVTGGLAAALAAAEETTPVLAMSSAPECTQCHLIWLDDFSAAPEDVLVPYERGAEFRSGREHAESSELMCYSCHDGYVADSRIRIRSGFQHPMAGISQLGRGRPAGARLLNEEQVYCGTCHTPHGPDSGQPGEVPLEENAFLRMGERPGSTNLCTLCHEFEAAEDKAGNHVMENEDYSLPEDLVAFHAQTATERGGIGCQTCHNLHGAPNRLLVLLGGSDGSSATLCEVCHKMDFSNEGLGRYSHPVGVRLDLNDPKPRYPNGEIIRLSESGTMNCLACHDLHESRVPAKLMRHTAPGSGLCAACHDDLFQAVGNTGHDLRLSAPNEQNVLQQTVEQGGLCSACHVPHKARLPYLWARIPRSGRHPLDRLCLSCHAAGGLSSKRINPTLSHPTPIDKTLIRAQVDPSDITLSVPVFDEVGRPAERGWVTCLTCHDAHHWRAEDGGKPLQDEAGRIRLGEGTLLDSFLKRKSHDQICKHCHGVWGLWRYRYFHLPLRGKR